MYEEHLLYLILWANFECTELIKVHEMGVLEGGFVSSDLPDTF